MKEFEIVIRVDGKEVRNDEVRQIEHERALNALHTLSGCGVDVKLNGKSIAKENIDALGREEAVEAAIQTKIDAGPDAIRAAMADILAESEADWRRIADESPLHEEMQECYVEMDVHGMQLQEFLAFNQKLNTSNDPRLVVRGAFGLNPEHYAFQAIPGGQHIIENLGQYKPVETILDMRPNDWLPVLPDVDTAASGKTEFYLVDRTPMKAAAMHQFKLRPYGFSVKLGMFFPKAMPAETVAGHKQHFCVEFLNAFTLCHDWED